MTARRRELLENGFTKFENVLDADFVARLRAATDSMLAGQPEAQHAALRAQGSLLHTTGDPIFAELVAYPPALEAMRMLGFDKPTFTDGYVISKPGHSPRLFWHYDWFAWQDAYSFGPNPPQVFAMYYLSDTTPQNGCLRVIPGSHVTHNALHDQLDAPHSEKLSRADDLSLAEFSTRSDEADVPVRAGDLLVGDARLLHAAHANETDARRTLITLWYQPDFAALPERIQAQIAAKVHPAPVNWPDEARARYAAMLPRYEGDAVPYERTLYRHPSEPAAAG